MDLTGLTLYTILVYNSPLPIEHKVYLEPNQVPLFPECRLQQDTTYAGRRFLCLGDNNQRVEITIEPQITK